jgi:hypothetical protein
MMRRLTVVASRGALAATTRPFMVNSPSLALSLAHSPVPCSNMAMTTRCLSSTAPHITPTHVAMPDMSKDQDILDGEAELMRQLDGHTPHSITGNQLIALVQELPIVVSHMESPEDPIAGDIIARTACLLKEYPKNFEVHLHATFDAIRDLKSDTPELCQLIGAVAHQVARLKRSFTDAESWTAISSLRDFSNSHPETLALVKAIASKLPVHNTKVEFTHMDDVLIALRGLNALDSDCVEVQELILAINFRLRHKKGKVKFFSSFQGESVTAFTDV